MGRFDIYSNPGRSKGSVPYLVDVQSNVISGSATRVVVPLRTLAGFASLTLPADLFPIITVDGKNYLLDTPQMGAIPLSELKVKAGSAQAYQHSDCPGQGVRCILTIFGKRITRATVRRPGHTGPGGRRADDDRGPIGGS